MTIKKNETDLTQPNLDSLLDSIPGPAVLIDLDYRIVATNTAYTEHYQAQGVKTEGKHCYEISHHYTRPCDQAGETCPLKLSLSSGEPQRVLHLHHTPRGEEHVDVETHPVRNNKGEIIYFLETMRTSNIANSQNENQGLVGRAPSFNKMLELVERVAPSASAVLLLGESGTGKEVIAKSVHDASQRKDGPFVPVECSGLTESLFESELFGHEKGSFTGAHSRKYGLIEAAKGGTLFLDEVGDIPLSLQVKLLRLIESNSFRRVGSTEPIKADFRLICATHRDLKNMIAEGSFRADLYYRISVFPIFIPALRERIEDLRILSQVLLKRINPHRKLTVSEEALTVLSRYHFPGNIRELRNILERASLLADGEIIRIEHFSEDIINTQSEQNGSMNLGREIIPLDELEKTYLQKVSTIFRGENKELARLLGVSERTLYRKLQALN